MVRLARDVLTELDLELVLRRVLESARELSGARYAALGVTDDSRAELERFITIGIDGDDRERIGDLPKGRGVLGELIAHPVPLRLGDVGAHPHSYGFPPGHPPMKTFLGVPVLIGGVPFGNLYLTEKTDGEEFTEEDEQTIMLLAEFAGVAIDHARRYSRLDAQHSELKRTVDALDATMQIARALGGETDLDLILGLVAKRGRALVTARALVIEHEQAGEMVVAAGAGELPAGLVGKRVDLRDSLASASLRISQTLRLEDQPNRARFERHGLGRLGVRADAGLVVPLIFRGRGYGVLIAVDRLEGGPAFSREDQRLLEAFAVSAATAVATAVTVEGERRRQRIAAAEQERAHWARELHDETLQNLAALRLGLAAQLQAHPRRLWRRSATRSPSSSRRSARCEPSSPTFARPPSTTSAHRRRSRIWPSARAAAGSKWISLSISPTSRAASRTDTSATSRPRCTGSSRKPSTTPRSTAAPAAPTSRSSKTTRPCE